MAENQWYYSQHDQMLGPVAAGELRRLAQSGRLLPSDLVWREGMADWAPAMKVKGLFPDSNLQAPRELGAAVIPATGTQRSAHAERATTGDSPVGLLTQATETSVGSDSPAPTSLFRDSPDPDLAAARTEDAALSPDQSPHDVALASPLIQPSPTPAPPLTSDAVGYIAGAPAKHDSGSKALPHGLPPMPVIDLLWWAQVTLWALCSLTVFVGGLLFLVACIRAKAPYEEASAAAVYGMFALGAYVLARTGERLSALLLDYFTRYRR